MKAFLIITSVVFIGFLLLASALVIVQSQGPSAREMYGKIEIGAHDDTIRELMKLYRPAPSWEASFSSRAKFEHQNLDAKADPDDYVLGWEIGDMEVWVWFDRNKTAKSKVLITEFRPVRRHLHGWRHPLESKESGRV